MKTTRMISVGLVGLVLALGAVGSAQAAINYFTGAVNDDFSVDGNWSGGVAPPTWVGENAIENALSSTIYAPTVVPGNWLMMGPGNAWGSGGTSSNGTLNIDGGSLTMTMAGDGTVYLGHGTPSSSPTGWLNVSNGGSLTSGRTNGDPWAGLQIGRDGGTGHATVSTGGSITSNTGIAVGWSNGNTPRATGTLEISGATSSITAATSWITVGFHGATGTLTQSGGTIDVPLSTVWIGVEGNGYGGGQRGNGTYDLSGGTLNTRQLSIGRNAADGTMNMSGGDVNLNEWVVLGYDGGSTGVLNWTGGTIDTGANFHVGLANSSTGTMNLSEGTGGTKPTLTVGGFLAVGQNTGTTGTVNQSAGDVTILGREGDYAGLIVGYGNNSVGTYNLSGGSVALTHGLTIGSHGGTVGEMNMSGGTLSADDWIIVGPHGGTGTLTLSGDAEMTATLVRNNGRTHLGWQGGHGTLHLDGGTLTTSQIVKGDGTGTMYWNGGTVKVLPMSGAWGGFVESLDAAYIQAGGAILDTNGNNAVIAQPLLHDPALGGTPDGGLTKTGAGTLTLSGANTYTGTTVVGEGIHVLDTTGAYAISGPVQMGTGSGSPTLRTYQPNQFAPGTVMVGANPWGQWARFDLLGNDQTLARITGDTSGLVIQNGGVGVAAPRDATLTVNGDADSYFNGHMRDTDGTGGYTLGLVKDGAGTLTLAASPG
ncbi:MAG: autotransporter-associated beta strand repeat-containing protein, partial [Planctomycetes bacterium]|nr:autotransporter-associated beta strand repeat-containing protein [Planctomycetota bacterium]